MKKRKEGVRKDWTRKKRLLLKAVFLGKQAFYRLQLRSVNYEFELIQGLFLVLECPKRKKEKKVMCVPPNIEWYFNGLPVLTDSRLSWRPNIEWYFNGLPVLTDSRLSWRIWPLIENTDDGRYECYIDKKHRGSITIHVITPGIWPLIENTDDGRYECYIDKKHRGSITIHVITPGEGIRRGLINYLITMTLAIPFVIFALFYRAMHPQRESIILDDPITEFYEKILDLKMSQMKGSVADEVYKEQAESKREEIRSAYSQPGA
ncbi:unnamed protein product [Gongylonema pulchrum]|uniref:Ig-like domain-containing protein n=1 Tax=Gongylonema pulchrum TaxID=637853 RepID=A0A183E684_9BILA|nr:unnamed protein product [Gongylonema pulchrum]